MSCSHIHVTRHRPPGVRRRSPPFFLDGLAQFRDLSVAAVSWDKVEAALQDFLSGCFANGKAELILPRRGEALDIFAMNDMSRSVTGNRAIVNRVLTPGYRVTGQPPVRATVATG